MDGPANLGTTGLVDEAMLRGIFKQELQPLRAKQEQQMLMLQEIQRKDGELCILLVDTAAQLLSLPFGCCKAISCDLSITPPLFK